MYSQRVTGEPKRCCNRNCREPFVKSSHKGYIPKNEAEIFAVMRCHKCGDQFMITQILMNAAKYKAKLPDDTNPRTRLPKGTEKPITLQEMERVRKHMDTENPLKTLFEGQKPGAPNKVGEE